MKVDNIIEIISNKSTISLFPKNIFEEITQNVRIIISTVMGSVPLDRRFGIDRRFIDSPEPKAMMKLIIFIVETIQEYEPRVEVLEVQFVNDVNSANDGKMYPKVKVRIIDGLVK